MKILEKALVSRRKFVFGASAAAAGLWTASAQAQDANRAWEDALKKILGDARPVEGRINFDMPEIAENGNTVPFTISMDSPMTEKDYVKAIHIISTGNPQPGVATFHYTPQSGKAAVSSRMRLARSQEVIAVAELNDGKFVIARRPVKVTIGGCGG
jgi:sulfur-oxidizing protein SoxY